MLLCMAEINPPMRTSADADAIKRRSTMKHTSNLSKLRLGLVATALVGGVALTSIGLSQGANAAPRYLQSGPYHEDVLANGVVTGPIAPDANN
jgi:hypothetical protein